MKEQKHSIVFYVYVFSSQIKLEFNIYFNGYLMLEQIFFLRLQWIQIKATFWLETYP